MKGHRNISSTQQSTSDNQLHANIIAAVWGDPFLSTIALSVIMDYQVISTDVIVIQDDDGLADNTHKFHKIDGFYFSLAVVYSNFIEHRDFQHRTSATVIIFRLQVALVHCKHI